MAKLACLLVLLLAVSIHSEVLPLPKINKYSSFYSVVRAANSSASETSSTPGSPWLTASSA